MRRRRPPPPIDHNARRWLAVRYLDINPPELNGKRLWGGPGWYVLRICECHLGQGVAHRFDSESAAAAAVDRLIEASEALGT